MTEYTNAVDPSKIPPRNSRQVDRAELRAYIKSNRREDNGFRAWEMRAQPDRGRSKYMPHTGAKERARHG